MSPPLLNKLNIAQLFAFCFLASLFLPIRYVFPTSSAFQTGAYSDFTSFSLYLSDIFLFLTLIFTISPRGGRVLPRGKGWMPVLALLLWLIIDLFAHFKGINSLNWWFSLKYAELIVAYGTMYYLFRKTTIKGSFLKLFVVFASFESVLAFWQFSVQHSIGGIFHKLGEQVLAPNILGVAKIVSGGTQFIRGYGTFPHPNLLSAFLVMAILVSLYFLAISTTRLPKILFSLAVFINCLGLTMTFSRAGFLALTVGLVVFFGYLIFRPQIIFRKKLFSTAAIVLASMLACFLLFRPFLATRVTITDDASLEREFYAHLGLQIVKANPIFGTGIGESVLHMQQYALFKLRPWQIQPVHNYFLLAAAEIGIIGSLILLWIFLSHLIRIAKKTFTKSEDPQLTTCYLLLTAILISFLILMQFDHYFYTLEQTQMLLWVVLGIIAATTRPQTTEVVSLGGQAKNPQDEDLPKT